MIDGEGRPRRLWGSKRAGAAPATVSAASFLLCNNLFITLYKRITQKLIFVIDSLMTHDYLRIVLRIHEAPINVRRRSITGILL